MNAEDQAREEMKQRTARMHAEGLEDAEAGRSPAYQVPAYMAGYEEGLDRSNKLPHQNKLDHAVELVGVQLYRTNPMVGMALSTIAHGASVEQALACAVQGLAQQNERMLKDIVMIASNRPMMMPGQQPPRRD